MPNNAGTVPTFSGKTSLSLSDLDALSDAVNSLHGTEYVPAAPHRGSRKYGLANFNTEEDNAGIIEAVEYVSGLAEPQITQGIIQLPPGGCGGSCSCVPAEYNECSGSVLGLIRSIDPSPSITSPVIENGAIKLPCADSCRGVTGLVSGVEVINGMLNPMLCYGLLYIPSADSCSGSMGLIKDVQEITSSSSAYISKGVLYLPVTCGGSCSCVPAEYNECSGSVLGLVRSVDPTAGIKAAEIVNGAIRLPYAYDNCNGQAVPGLVSGVRVSSSVTSPYIAGGTIFLPASGSGDLLGVRDVYGNGIPWASVNNTVLSTHYVGSYKYDLKATYDSGFLCLQIIQDLGES